MNRLGLLAGLAALGALPAAAEELKPQSSIETVTVYPLGASVTRHVPITLPAGSSAVIIDDLPGDLEADSVKVDGAADQAIEIGSVETRLAPADAEKDPKRQAILDEIQALNDRLAAANDKLGALDGRQKFIEKLIDTTPAGFGRALGQSGDGVERWSVAAETIGSELAAIADAARALHIEERTIQTGIDAKTKALAELPEPRAHTILTVALSAGAPATGALTVAYRVADARWVPTYDAMLTTGDKGGKPAVAIVRRAEVTQATGEDWSNVAMTLSTARPSGGTAAPQLEPSLASFVVDEVPYPAAASGALRDERAPAPMAKEMDAVSAPADRPVQILEAAADFGDFRAQYRVPGAVSVESGVGARGLRIATDDGGAELAVRAAPALSDAAYLSRRPCRALPRRQLYRQRRGSLQQCRQGDRSRFRSRRSRPCPADGARPGDRRARRLLEPQDRYAALQDHRRESAQAEDEHHRPRPDALCRGRQDCRGAASRGDRTDRRECRGPARRARLDL